jgi:hypothetical protein
MVEKYFENLNPKFYEKPIQLVDTEKDKKNIIRKRIHKKYLETTWHKSHIADSEPKVLTLDDLEFGFVVWLLSIVLPVIVFLLEIVSIFITKIKNRKEINAINQETNEPVIETIEIFESTQTQVEEILPKSSPEIKKKYNEKLDSLNLFKD